jgi:2-keto-myo-inositol isomerase
MLRGLTRAGIGAIGNDEQYITKAAEFGFQSLDLNPLELIKHYGSDYSKQLLENKQITIGSFDLSVDWRTTEEQFREGLKSLLETAQAAVTMNCFKCCTYILPSTDENTASFMVKATRRLRLCAEILCAFGIRLGLEFVGSHHLRTHWKNPFICSMDDTLDWIDTINSKNVGLLLDSYHWHTNGLDVQDIIKLKQEQIVHVHINDAYKLPIEELLDSDRIYPGEGGINLQGFLESLQAIGYSGVVAQEVISPNNSQNSIKLLTRSKKAFDKVFESFESTINRRDYHE